MPETLVTIAYLVAGLLFIFSPAGLSAQESARRGNLYGMAGMVMAYWSPRSVRALRATPFFLSRSWLAARSAPCLRYASK